MKTIIQKALCLTAGFWAVAPALTAQELTAEYVVAMEVLDDRIPLTKFEEGLRILASNPGHPLVVDLIEAMGNVPDGADLESMVQGMTRLRPRLTNASARIRVGDWLSELEWNSSATDMPLNLGEDLYSDWFANFWWMGPLGALTDPEPMWTQLEPGNNPEHGLKAEYSCSWGAKLSWNELQRAPRSSSIPGDNQPYLSGGLVYFLTGAKLTEGRGWLEIESGQSVRAVWNGERVLFRKQGGLSQVGSRFLVPVQFKNGVNSLLLVSDGSQWMNVGVRLLSETHAAIDPGSVTLEELMAVKSQPRAEGESPLWAEIAVDWREPLGEGPFAPVLQAIRHRNNGRPDLALALPAPEAGLPLVAWRRLAHGTLGRVDYLPDEVKRARRLELEEALIADGGLGLAVATRRLRRLVEEDKAIEAATDLAALREQVGAHPSLDWISLHIASELDEEGTLLRSALREASASWPTDAQLRGGLADNLGSAGNNVQALENAVAAIRLGSDDEDVLKWAVQGLAARPGDVRRDWLLGVLERRVALYPANWQWEHQLQNTLKSFGMGDLALNRKLVHAEKHPGDFGSWQRLLTAYMERGASFGDPAFDKAMAHLERLEPAQNMVLAERRVAGQPVSADAFFTAFAPDEAAAWQAAEDLTNASTVEVLDSGMVYLSADGSALGRVHTITLALDRKGTEDLHEVPASGTPLVARVRKQDGTFREPVMVEGSWVMPSLDAGDAVEMQFEWGDDGTWGAPGSLSMWSFASFERPFGLSRYVVFVPPGLQIELRTEHFVGVHVTEQWGGGTVHVLTAEHTPRQEAEPLMPSYVEILPCARFATDRDLSGPEQNWRQTALVVEDLPMELGQALDVWIAELDAGLSPGEKARVLYDRLAERLVDFGGSAAVGEVWFSKRGQPILLYGALLRRAGIAFEWALLEKGVSPEIDSEPVALFKNQGSYGQPVIRIPDGEQVIWQVPPGSKGTAFGTIPDAMAGAKVLVLHEDGTSFQEMSRDQLQDSWNTALDLNWTVNADGSASMDGSWSITTEDGANLRRQLAQAAKAQRDGFVRRYIPSFVPGLDLGEYEIKDLQTPGADFVLTFVGTRPDFLEATERGHKAELRLPNTGLSTGLGPSQRIWPLAARVSNRMHLNITVTYPEDWTVLAGPQPFKEERMGYRHTVAVDNEGQTWSLQRIFELRGLLLEADEMPSFLERAAELEREESRPLELKGPAESSGEAPADSDSAGETQKEETSTSGGSKGDDSSEQ